MPVLFIPSKLSTLQSMVTCLKLHSNSRAAAIVWTRELILPMLLLKSLAAVAKVNKYTVPGNAVRHTSGWKNTSP